MWVRWVRRPPSYDEQLPGLRRLDGTRAARGATANGRLPFLLEGIRLRRRHDGRIASCDPALERGRGRRGDHGRGRGGRAGVRGVRFSPSVPRGPSRSDRGGLRRVRDHHRVRAETRGPFRGPGETPPIRGAGASGTAVPPMRSSSTVLHRRRRDGGRGVRLLREPIHLASTAWRGRGWSVVRTARLPPRSRRSPAIPWPRGRPTVPSCRPGRAFPLRGGRPTAEAPTSSGRVT